MAGFFYNLRLEYSSHNPLINSQNLFYDDGTNNERT
jgi:hypothetical protein